MAIAAASVCVPFARGKGPRYRPWSGKCSQPVGES